MKGLGTNATRLVTRLMRIHFDADPRHLVFVKEVYLQRYGRELADRVKKETKGPFRDLLVRMLEGKGDVGVAEAFC